MEGIISGNILKDHPHVLQEAENKSKEAEINLKILGVGMILVEIFRQNREPVFGSRSYSKARMEKW